MKLVDWARKQGIAYITAYRWYKSGKLPVEAYQTDSGTIIVKDEKSVDETMTNESMSLFLKKIVEFSKNNSSIEDFAAFIISNYSLKLNSLSDDKPIYSKNKPKTEDIQNHFKQFIPKGDKPKPNMFMASPSLINDISDEFDVNSSSIISSIPIVNDNIKETLKEFSAALAENSAVPLAYNSVYQQKEAIDWNNFNLVKTAASATGAFEPTQKELKTAHEVEAKVLSITKKRGRKSKKDKL